MVSSGNPSKSTLSDASRQRVLAYFQGGWAKQLDVDQMFTLINGILPIEACLYYQVLPLFLDGNRLYLGMVTPNDTSALEYVRRIVSYLNYSLVPRAITYEAMQVALTAYLNFTGAPEQSNDVKPRELFSYGHYRHSAQMRADYVDPSIRPTLILDDSEELERIDPDRPNPDCPDPDRPDPDRPEPASTNADRTITLPLPLQPEVSPQTTVSLATVLSDSLIALPDQTVAEQTVPSQAISDQATKSGMAIGEPTHPPSLEPPTSTLSLFHSLPTLEIQANHLSSAVEVLASLPAPAMLQELLARALASGIGRLYFECHPQYGRILCSQDGVLQSVLEQLALPTFRQLLDELKRVAEISASAIGQPRQVDVERLYENNRVLLRFRFMSGNHGEEATLQVLRGAALRFHQRQQFSKLKRDALGIARQLQTKLSEIRDRAYTESGLASADTALPALNQLLQNIEAQLETLESDRTDRTEPS